MFSTFKTYLVCAQDYSHFISCAYKCMCASLRACVCVWSVCECCANSKLSSHVPNACYCLCNNVICIVYWNSVCVYGISIFLFIYKLFICAWTVCPSMCIYYIYYALSCIVFCVVLYISCALSKWILCKMLSYIIVIVRSVFVYGRPNSNNSSRRYIVIRRICE